jgi:hypothetical protein
VAEVEADGVDHAASERVSVEFWLGSHGSVIEVQLPDDWRVRIYTEVKRRPVWWFICDHL